MLFLFLDRVAKTISLFTFSGELIIQIQNTVFRLKVAQNAQVLKTLILPIHD